jgi:hypothetical protein
MKVKLTAIVTIPRCHPYELTVTLHESHTTNDRLVSGNALYRHARSDLYPDGTHFEMELSNDTVSTLAIPKPSIIHAVLGENGKYFVCYPNKIETQGAAEDIFKIWATGSVASLDEEKDLLRQHFNPEISTEGFLKIMKIRYGVTLANFKITVEE